MINKIKDVIKEQLVQIKHEEERLRAALKELNEVKQERTTEQRETEADKEPTKAVSKPRKQRKRLTFEQKSEKILQKMTTGMPVTTKQLSELTKMTHSTVKRTLQQMEEAKLIQQVGSVQIGGGTPSFVYEPVMKLTGESKTGEKKASKQPATTQSV